MRICLATIGEPVPVQEGAHDRLHRTGYFARFLAQHGHTVTWWTSTFDHFRKRHLFDDDTTQRGDERLTIRLLHGCGYRSNLSLARFRDHRQIARKFAALIEAEADPPDILVAALPTIELCLEAIRYGKRRQKPVVLDMRDMWPDIFADHLPAPARPLARLVLRPMFRDARRACAGATAITGITEAFVDWGLQRGNRPRSPLDRAFPMGYISQAPSEDKIRAAEHFWSEQGIPANPAFPVAVFVGTLGRQFDLETVIAAARKLSAQNHPLRFLICGTGDRLDHYRQMAAGLQNVTFPGWVDAAKIHVLMRRATIGLDPLPDRYDFLATINNKAIEYMSAGLPILSSPARGVLADLLASEQCGMSYDIGDVDGLTDLLARTTRDCNLARSLADNAQRVFREKFTAEKVYGAMMAYLQEIAVTFPEGKP
ncbi:MAG: glycosyltransferase family 4 protein [Pirellulales bacterium]|nr:glycosyltransferase family 4 protein [Pirellulales bacterium]